MVPWETVIMPNLVYLLLMAGVWLAAMAIASPGTGLLEVAAVLVLIVAGIGTFGMSLDLWALLVIVLGGVCFVGALRWRRMALWLALAAVLLSVGSAFLLGMEAGRTAVDPLLAATVSLLTVGFFWVAVRRSVLALRAPPVHDPERVLGQVGEVRSVLDPVGSVYVGGELWSARSEVPMSVGSTVRVRGRDGLLLLVEPVSEAPAGTP